MGHRAKNGIHWTVTSKHQGARRDARILPSRPNRAREEVALRKWDYVAAEARPDENKHKTSVEGAAKAPMGSRDVPLRHRRAPAATPARPLATLFVAEGD